MHREGLVILGYYGAGNFGDDLMLRGLLSELSAFKDLTRVTVVSYYSGAIDFPREVDSRFRIVRLRSPVAKMAGLVPLFLRNRIAIFGGGTPFTDTEGDGSYKFFRLARLLGCRFAYLCVGIGKLAIPERRRRAIWLLQRAEAVIFREPESYRRACGLLDGSSRGAFSLGEDLCFLDKALDDGASLAKPGDRDAGSLLVSWRHLPEVETGIDPDALIGSFLDALRVLQKHREFHTIEILPLDSTSDADIHESLTEKIAQIARGTNVVLRDGCSLDGKLAHIRKAGLYLSVRLHGALVGKILGVPTIGFNYSPKVEYMFAGIESKSLLQWDDMLNNSECLLPLADCAFDEAQTQIDTRARTALARSAVQELMNVYMQ